MEEIWTNIELEGFEGLYKVSSLGNVQSFHPKGNIMKITISKDMYASVGLKNKGKNRRYRVHRFVAKAFIPNPENKPCVNHINGIKSDNRVENLEWCTYSENQIHSHRVLGSGCSFTGKFGKDNYFSKSVLQFTKEGVFIKEWDSMMDIERDLKISHSHISQCCNGKLKSARGFIWKYKNPS